MATLTAEQLDNLAGSKSGKRYITAEELDAMVPQPMRGVRRGFSRLAAGGKQTAEDIKQFTTNLGKPSSDSRIKAYEDAAAIQAESMAAHPDERYAEAVAPALIGGLLPFGRGAAADMAVNALGGMATGMLEPASSPNERANNAIEQGAYGAALPGLVRSAGGLYRGGRAMFGGRYGAANELSKQDVLRQGNLGPLEAPSFTEDLAPGEMGPPRPKYASIPGINPHAGMLSDDPRIYEMERNARMRDQPGWRMRDIQNMTAINEALRARALPKSERKLLEMNVNQRTTPIRETAFRLADMSGKQALPASRYVEALKNSGAQREIKNFAVPFLEEGSSDDIYRLRSELTKRQENATKAAGGADPLSAALNSDLRLSTGIKNAVDEGIDNNSYGLYGLYMRTHARMMRPIEEGRIFQNILDDAEYRPRVEGTRDVRDVTPYFMRKQINDNTYKQLGRFGEVDRLSAQGRMTIEDALKALESQAASKSGPRSTTGSDSIPKAMSLGKQAIDAGGGASIGSLIRSAVSSVGKIKSAAALRRLDAALLNPGSGDLASIFKAYNRQNKPLPQSVRRLLDAAYQGAADDAGKR